MDNPKSTVADSALAVGVASLFASINIVRLLAMRGLASPTDVDDISEDMTEALEELAGEDFVGSIRLNLDNLFIEAREQAAKNWRADP